jgi:hypothetical protein
LVFLMTCSYRFLASRTAVLMSAAWPDLSQVTKPVEPAHKLVGLSNFEHLRTVASWLQQVKDLFAGRAVLSKGPLGEKRLPRSLI